VERRYETDDMRGSGELHELQTREMRQRRNCNNTKLRTQQLVLDLALRTMRNCDLVAMVEPHARGRRFGDICVVEVMRELETVTPASNDQSKSEDW